jgi:hypothetical protein
MRSVFNILLVLGLGLGVAGCSQGAETSLPSADVSNTSDIVAPVPGRSEVAEDEEPYRPGTSPMGCSPDLVANGLECLPTTDIGMPEDSAEASVE